MFLLSMQATGIHIDGPYLRRVVLKKKNQTYELVRLETKEVSSTSFHENVKQLDTETLVSGLASDELIVRSHTFSLAKSNKLRKALILQTETQLHLKPEELITVSVIDSQNKKATTFSTTLPSLKNHLQAFNNLHLNPERVSAIPAALQGLVQWKSPDLSSYFLVDIGLSITNCIWVENDELKKAHAARFDLQLFKKSIPGQPFDEIDFSIIKTNQYPAFSEEARAFRREISKILHSFQCSRPIIFTGISWLGFREFLLETLHDCILEEKKLNFSPNELRYAISIGLALNYLRNRQEPIQFRPNSFLSSRSWIKLGSISSFLLGASTLIAALFLAAGIWWMDKREGEIVHTLETWTAAKDPALRRELFLAGSETKDLVNQWLKLVDKNTKDYRFLMKAKTASEFIDWLTHHPLVESFHATPQPISFEQIHYQLVSLPRLDAMDNPYLVKIDLDFKTQSPLHARKFHEELLQKSDWIDTSREITWETLNDHYKSSFYLKNS